MKIVIIVILSLVILYMFFYILHIRKKLISILTVLKAIKKGDKRKAFTKGPGITSEICYEMNEIVATYQSEITRLKKTEQANKQLLTSLSHDVRTPLTSLLGYLDALESGIVTGKEKMQYIKIARNKAYDLTKFVNTLFDWFKLDSHEQTFYFEPIDINEYSKEIIIAWLPVLEQKRKEIEVEINDNELIVPLDKNAYSRIINNLIQNAIQHGKCTLFKIKIKREKSSASIIISDNGVGISKEKLPYIFDRLYKCDDARSHCGSGLGLAIVKELVVAHNGTITVESLPNVNTTFTITIPF
ncbi:sensor histidine kinase [Tepidibacter hydrothermalis]|uniref:histidine kinase n=1 Tax=Tepidibacter hydrothermalis TaxID=3036126 RepID=A0ABY8E7P5_9FIRM|nr:HAMP domain-containing sensor histidine kinase [Tepidibacter hydrothermalis]WFD08912.1 HAMP domain-containing sensor histidine kinase [Tepidibacter hydrothermalis]